MARPSHPHAMQPKKPGSTRTAAPQMPPKFPMSGRYRAYTLFDWTGLIYRSRSSGHWGLERRSGRLSRNG